MDDNYPAVKRIGCKNHKHRWNKKFYRIAWRVHVTSVESLTGYPSILGGRVKTLHPKIFGGILSRRDNQGDVSQLTEYAIPEIDLVMWWILYPFESTVASGSF
jgi:AICAR transformylase/IMP cyclohydrolase PurH